MKTMMLLLTGLCIAARSPAQGLPDATTVVAGPIAARADSVLGSLEIRGFSGVVLLARHGSVLLQKGYGLANRAARTRMTPSTVVQIGSNTKDLTAIAILQLYQDGKLQLDDSMSRFFRGVPADKRGITVQHLLTHRSGLVNNVGSDYEPIARATVVSRAMASTLRSTPGAREAYSNVGYSLLAAIIELVSGQSYEAYLRDHILAPLQLHDVGLVLPGFDPARLAHGYRGDEDVGTMLTRPHAADGSWWNLRGNGGVVATVPAMYRLYTALFSPGDPLLEPATRDLRFDPRRAMILAGSDLVSSFLIDHNPMTGIDLIVASNSSRFSAERVRDTLSAALGWMNPAGARMNRISSSTGDTAFGYPDTPAARAAASYLRAYNTGDSEVMRRFFTDSMAPPPSGGPTIAQRVDRYRGLHDNLGTLTPTTVKASSPNQLVLQLRPGTGGGEVFITFNVEPGGSHRLTSLNVEVD